MLLLPKLNLATLSERTALFARILYDGLLVERLHSLLALNVTPVHLEPTKRVWPQSIPSKRRER